MLKIEAFGNIGNDAELIKLENDRHLIKFSLAHSYKFKNKVGNTEEKTIWITCNCWNKSEKLLQYLTKGKKIFVEGDPVANGFISKDGEIKASLEINVNRLEF